eukprot:3370166-Karenia_brevis.AAC.1
MKSGGYIGPGFAFRRNRRSKEGLGNLGVETGSSSWFRDRSELCGNCGTGMARCAFLGRCC